MKIGFNLFANVVWWELALVVLLLAAYALAPVLCVVREGVVAKRRRSVRQRRTHPEPTIVEGMGEAEVQSPVKTGIHIGVAVALLSALELIISILIPVAPDRTF